MSEQANLESAIAALEAQRSVLGDAMVDASIAVLRRQLAKPSPVPPEEQRKPVTVFFADLAGWTAMGEQLDPEEVQL